MRVTVALAPACPAGCPSLIGLDSPYQDGWNLSSISSSQQSGSRTKGPRGGIRHHVPLTAPPTAFSHQFLCQSTRSPWECKSSGSVSVSSSVGSHDNLDRVAGSTWVALVQPPACVVMPPLVAHPSRVVEVILPSFLPAAPSLGWLLTQLHMSHWYC